MKTNILVLSIFFFALSASAADKARKGEVSLIPGFELGLNFANATVTSPTTNVSSRTGLIFGGNLEVGLTENFFVQPGIRYIQKGAESVSTVAGSTVTTAFNFDYLEFPVLAKAKLADGDFKPFAFFGPSFGVLLSANLDSTANSRTTSTNISSNTENTDFSLLFGVGGEYPLNKTMDLTASIGFSLGLTDVNTTSVSWKNTGTQLLAGAKWNL